MRTFIGEVAPAMSSDLARAIFRAFDRSSSHAISFEEFICGVAVVLEGTPAERLQLVASACNQVLLALTREAKTTDWLLLSQAKGKWSRDDIETFLEALGEEVSFPSKLSGLAQ